MRWKSYNTWYPSYKINSRHGNLNNKLSSHQANASLHPTHLVVDRYDKDRWADGVMNVVPWRHIKRNCPKLKQDAGGREMPQEQRQEDERNVNSSYRHGSGLFVAASINGQTATCLVDTGATLTVLSTRYWENLCESDEHVYPPSTKKLYPHLVVPWRSRVRTTVCVKIGSASCDIQVIVANIENDALLDVDFLKQEMM